MENLCRHIDTGLIIISNNTKHKLTVDEEKVDKVFSVVINNQSICIRKMSDRQLRFAAYFEVIKLGAFPVPLIRGFYQKTTICR